MAEVLNFDGWLLQLGVAHLQSTSRHGERMSTNAAFLRPVRAHRRNLRVLTQAHVTRVLFGVRKNCLPPQCEPAAIEVEYLYGGTIRRARARREIILSAGKSCFFGRVSIHRQF